MTQKQSVRQMKQDNLLPAKLLYNLSKDKQNWGYLSMNGVDYYLDMKKGILQPSKE